MSAPGPAYAARLARFLKRRLARKLVVAPPPAGLAAAAVPLTSAQKTASERRLRRTCVAQLQQV